MKNHISILIILLLPIILKSQINTYSKLDSLQLDSCLKGLKVCDLPSHFLTVNNGKLADVNLSTLYTSIKNNINNDLPNGGGSGSGHFVSPGSNISFGGSGTQTSPYIINNTAPDQVVTLVGAGINNVTGTYPNYTITGTEVDGSTTNELQTISLTGNQLSLSNNGGTVTLPSGDNWGTDVVHSNGTLTGNGTTASPMGIAQQGATTGQVLKWNGTAWVPGTATGDNWGTDVVHSNGTLTGNGTTASPMGIAQQGATTGQVLKWNGTAWIPGTAAGDNWGNQVVEKNSTLTGSGINTSLLSLSTIGTAGSYGNETNVPNLTTDSYGRVTNVTNIPIPTASSTTNGLLTSTDWSSFNNGLTNSWKIGGNVITSNPGIIGFATNSTATELQIKADIANKLSLFSQGQLVHYSSNRFWQQSQLVHNLKFGFSAINTNTTGNYNILAGYEAGRLLTTGSNNIYIGRNAGYIETSTNNKLIINSDIDTLATPLIYGDFTNSEEYLNINGKVKINSNSTTTATYPLEVTGDTKITGAIRTSSNIAGTSGQVLTSTGTSWNWTNLSPYIQVNHDTVLNSTNNSTIGTSFDVIKFSANINPITGFYTFSSTTNTITIASAGYYKIEYSSTGNTVGNQKVSFSIFIGGSQTKGTESNSSILDIGGSGSFNLSRSLIVSCDANTTIQLKAKRTGGTSALCNNVSMIVTKL